MFRNHVSRSIATATLALVVASQSGCFNDSTTSPTPTPAPTEPPALPAPDRLSFNFDYFQPPAASERSSKANFFNAYVRVTVASAITQFLLAPPVAAFALALHTVPSPQSDGSFIWVYTWVDGTDEVQVRLRGLPLETGRVSWEMRVSNSAEGYSNELWFEGETWENAQEGQWHFHDFQRTGKPVVAQLEWGHDADGNFLRLSDELDHPGNYLEYREDLPFKSFTYNDAAVATQTWMAKWSTDGSGSLTAGDYNGGAMACWDHHQNDTVCTPAQ